MSAVVVGVTVKMFVGRISFPLRQKDLSRPILLAVGVHIHFGRRDSSAGYSGNLELCADVQCRYRVLQQLGRYSCID
jgi:hypothetical protein